ncbi:39S ribosomal protein L42, mitochondrial [Thrips palmi]|uniref:Large ribosomal subunit protein mL42 n=1 Tax=Thrips palmi TaxID=161013 RepID=A0A6P8ZAC8_THRPL|nr:39S ribosomal protein L42, mitochondrial [Thrips palmi]XP_034244087.1 39S ribosomal protein L42, mitochondrial [Thrips palmi]XP_034244088.1 39S ribosomal protein L42, mitochondrial [Thrips palmi]
MFGKSTVLSLARRGYGLMNYNPSLPLAQSFSSKSPATQVVFADDGRTLVCWHPEPEFPYEHTLPIPEEAQQTALLKELNKGFRDVSHLEGMKEELAREELMKMTSTTKHRWFPRLQKKKAKKTPRERPYL